MVRGDRELESLKPSRGFYQNGRSSQRNRTTVATTVTTATRGDRVSTGRAGAVGAVRSGRLRSRQNNGNNQPVEIISGYVGQQMGK